MKNYLIRRLRLIVSIITALLVAASAKAATQHVTQNGDNGAGSLRQAIADAQDGDVIDFTISGTINLVSALIVAKNFTIEGPGARLLQVTNIKGGPAMAIDAGAPFISGLTLSNSRQGAIVKGGNATLTECTISGNTGGGLQVFSPAQLALVRCSIVANTTDQSSNIGRGGGGIYANGTVTLTSCTIYGNTADGGGSDTMVGGGISAQGGQINVVNCTIAKNKVVGSGNALGGGIFKAGGTVTLLNTIVADNTSNFGPDLDSGINGNFSSSGHNLIRNADVSTGFTDGVFNDKVGTGANPIDPYLRPLANNGGPTDTTAPLIGSPAIDAGNNFAAPNRDQRNYRRSGVADIGAVEFFGTIPVNLANISTRAAVGSGEKVCIAGFIVSGPVGAQKKLLIRVLGPSLAAFGVPGTLQDPYLELHDSNDAVVPNDNWQNDPNENKIPANFTPNDGLESALLVTLAPGSYTVVAKGVAGGIGNALSEIYDLDPTSAATVANISTRAFVDTGDNVLIAGFIVGGVDTMSVVVRALGPSLTPFGVEGAVQDPTLEVHDGNGSVTSNDDWAVGPNAASIPPELKPADGRESALFMILQPGNYTAIVRGKNGSTGVSLVEVYGLN